MALVLAKRTSEDAIQVKVQVTEYSMYVPPSLVVPIAAPFSSRNPEYSTVYSYILVHADGRTLQKELAWVPVAPLAWASWLRGVYLL